MRDLGKLIVAKGFKSSPKSNKSPNLVSLIRPTFPVAEFGAWTEPNTSAFEAVTTQCLKEFFFKFRPILASFSFTFVFSIQLTYTVSTNFLIASWTHNVSTMQIFIQKGMAQLLLNLIQCDQMAGIFL